MPVSEYNRAFSESQFPNTTIPVSEYNRRVSEYNRRVSEYNRRVSEYNRRVSEYNRDRHGRTQPFTGAAKDCGQLSFS